MNRNLFFHVLSGMAIWLIFAAIGCALIHANIPGVTRNAFDLIPPLQSWEMTGVGFIMVLLCMLYLVTFAPRRAKKRYLSFASEGGTVSISVSAVSDYIRKFSGEFSTVVDIDPQIKADKNSISIILNVKLVAGSRIPELEQALKIRVRESLRNELGIDDVKEIKVNVQEIVGEPSSSRRGWRS